MCVALLRLDYQHVNINHAIYSDMTILSSRTMVFGVTKMASWCKFSFRW